MPTGIQVSVRKKKLSVLRAIRRARRRQKRNYMLRSKVKTLAKKVRTLLETHKGEWNEEDKRRLAEAYRQFTKAIDKASKRYIFHPNNASRRKSRLAKKMYTHVGEDVTKYLKKEGHN